LCKSGRPSEFLPGHVSASVPERLHAPERTSIAPDDAEAVVSAVTARARHARDGARRAVSER